VINSVQRHWIDLRVLFTALTKHKLRTTLHHKQCKGMLSNLLGLLNSHGCSPHRCVWSFSCFSTSSN